MSSAFLKKTCIYVFSGTGTSLAVAKRIGDSLGDTEIQLIPKALEQSANNKIENNAENIGFVFPNYFGDVPAIVIKFIRSLDLENTDYVFAVVTGGKGIGYCLGSLERELKEKGKGLNYGKSITGSSNYIVAWYYKMVSKTGEKRAILMKEIDEKAIRFSKEIAERKKDIDKDQFVSHLVSRLLSPKKIIEDTRAWDNDFTIDTNCIGCGTCMKVCQVKNIEIKDGRPEYLHNCQRCMACIQYCPKNAIGFKGKPLQKPRYYHPDYPAAEIIRLIEQK
jgi:ferredoxin/flavodoxin